MFMYPHTFMAVMLSFLLFIHVIFFFNVYDRDIIKICLKLFNFYIWKLKTKFNALYEQ